MDLAKGMDEIWRIRVNHLCKINPFIKYHSFITVVLEYSYILININVIEDNLFYFKDTLFLFIERRVTGTEVGKCHICKGFEQISKGFNWWSNLCWLSDVHRLLFSDDSCTADISNLWDKNEKIIITYLYLKKKHLKRTYRDR